MWSDCSQQPKNTTRSAINRDVIVDFEDLRIDLRLFTKAIVDHILHITQ